ncbi:hypothetical protein S40285_04906 [Stachybotrys chlorohalonatus IBT 40285]|uniref:GAR domain-containing protein n=1 Tax=Stachybotrys chlorohalonatus (strain IBT 40285) TaxID=1283841 RepID=A0A084QGZ3_STAC4|nr:hypothetical protein S40285_04906 [Stachybotrys chlorohalonata IBT 40285]
MHEAPQLLKPTRHTSGQSPTRHRAADDLLAHLSPATVIEALNAPTGALQRCLDGASAAERDFALRTAIASGTIWNWLEELREWMWPDEGGSAGFEIPAELQKQSSARMKSADQDEPYIGSLPARAIVTYEAKIAQIRRDLEGLGIEDLKNHVLFNHIMPLSRPSTPLSDPNRSRPFSSYTKMEDLTAVVTVIVAQTLPNLAKLTSLLRMWTIRLTVLRRVPSLLRAIEDAEVALQSGWNAIKHPRPDAVQPEANGSPASTLARDAFGIMKLVVKEKISQPARDLDNVLDYLEGLPDTVPAEWLDRMEAVERGYPEWVAACERKIVEAEQARHSGSRRTAQPSIPHEEQDGNKPVDRSHKLLAIDPDDSAIALPQVAELEDLTEPSKEKRDHKDVTDSPLQASSPVTYDGSEEVEDISTDYERSMLESQNDSVPMNGSQDFDRDEDDELELPPLHNGSRRSSDVSEASTVVRGASSYFDIGASSDLPEVSASPDIARARVREAEYVDVSPPSSPPPSQTGMREESMMTEDSHYTPTYEDDEIMSIHSSMLDDYDDSISVSEVPTPLARRESNGDQQLRKQISDIIENIPAKIRLTNEPARVNLNPPDLQLPQIRRKTSREPYLRSLSSLSNVSTRTATPSFTLSPAKNIRPRHQRGQQEIKVYHLSRSTGEAPIKLFIRCVGENGERVMVRVGGGWADLSEYLKEYASHHGRRSKGPEKAKVEVRDVPRGTAGHSSQMGSSPPSRPASALAMSPATPLNVRKTRRSMGATSGEAPRFNARTPVGGPSDVTPSPDDGARSSPNSRLSWVEEDSSFLGLAGPTGRKKEMSQENKAWVESVKEKVRLASGEMKASHDDKNRFGELGKVGGTKRLFPKAEDRRK